MDDHQRWRGFLAGLLVLALLAVMFLTARPRETLSPLEQGLRDLLEPVETTLAAATGWVRQRADQWRSWRELQEENRRLREEIAALRAERYRLLEAGRQNQFLRNILGLTYESRYQWLPALVIGRPLSNWWNTITINRGARDGVAPRMPVLTRDGVVGYVQTVTARTADVLLLVDSQSALGGVVVRTSEPVVVEGVADPQGGLRVRALVAGADLREGDEVVTSSLSQIYPPGLPVGRIHTVVPVPPGRAAEAWLTPAVDFNRLEAVAVLVSAGRETEGDQGRPAGEGD